MLKEADFEEFRERLQLLKARLRGDVEHLTGEALDRGRSDGESPTHMAELGSTAYEQDFSLFLMENDQEVLKEIDAALHRIQDGTYGQCEGCISAGKPASKCGIPKARLRAIPYTQECVNCKRKREESAI